VKRRVYLAASFVAAAARRGSSGSSLAVPHLCTLRAADQAPRPSAFVLSGAFLVLADVSPHQPAPEPPSALSRRWWACPLRRHPRRTACGGRRSAVLSLHEATCGDGLLAGCGHPRSCRGRPSGRMARETWRALLGLVPLATGRAGLGRPARLGSRAGARSRRHGIHRAQAVAMGHCLGPWRAGRGYRRPSARDGACRRHIQLTAGGDFGGEWQRCGSPGAGQAPRALVLTNPRRRRPAARDGAVRARRRPGAA
jgi:hypothetical protein